MTNECCYTINEWAYLLDVEPKTIYKWLSKSRPSGIFYRLDEDSHYRIYISEDAMDEIITSNKWMLTRYNNKSKKDSIEQILNQLEQLEDRLYDQCLIVEELRMKIEKTES